MTEGLAVSVMLTYSVEAGNVEAGNVVCSVVVKVSGVVVKVMS